MIDLIMLRESVEETFGEKITTNKQCKLLETIILEKTNRRISTATLRRFFGLLPSSTKLSKYNTVTLVAYSNYDTENKFTDKLNSLWEDIKKEAQSYTDYYIQSIKNKSISDYNQSINRDNVEENLNSFIDSDNTYTTLIAPGGHGKSTLLAKWLENPDNNLSNNDIILFTNALIFENTFQNNNKAKVINFSLNKTNSLQLIKQNLLSKGRFLLIVDAVDELSLNIEKLKRFITWFIELLTKNNDASWFKVILSVRDVTYDNYIAPLFSQKTSDNQNDNNLYYTENKIKVPSFERQEVISILQKTLGHKEQSIFLDQIIDPDIFSLIRTPINLALYKTNILKNRKKEELTAINLYQQLLDTYIFNSLNFEEKIDILELIINELINCSTFAIQKKKIKKQYPIHLKQNDNYFHAYNELLKDGILHEYLQNDKNNVPTYYISFKHVNIYYYLCAIHFIKHHGELNHILFDKVAKDYGNLEFKINVTSYLFSIAYKNENIEAIRNFYNLDESILNSIDLAITVGMCLRDKNNIQKELILNYAQNIQAQKHLFELFVDIDHLIQGYNYQLSIYNQYANTNESNIFCNSIHLYHSLLTLNKKEAKYHFTKLNKFKYSEDLFPWPIGRYLGYSILYSAFCENQHKIYSPGYILKYRDIAYKNFHSGYQNEYLFDITIIFALAITGQFHEAVEYGETVIDLVNKIEHTNSFYYYAENFHYDVIQAILVFSRFKLTGNIIPNDIDKLTSFAVTNISHFSSYQYISIINFFASELLLKNGNQLKAKEYYDISINLCKHCKYDLFKAYIMYNNPFNNPELKKQGEQIFEISGFFKTDITYN